MGYCLFVSIIMVSTTADTLCILDIIVRKSIAAQVHTIGVNFIQTGNP